MEERLKTVLSSFEGTEEELIPVLQAVQQEFGYLPEEALLSLSRFLGVPESRVYAVATFYAQFRFTPIGRNHIMICRGTACHVQGAPRILQAVETQLGIKAGETTPDMEFSLETVACIGACGLAPTITVNGEPHGHLTAKKVTAILDRARVGGGEEQDED